MLFHCYLKNNAVYVPTVVRLKTGAYQDVDPVAVVPVANYESLRRALLDSMARKNVIVPPPPKDSWPPPVLLKYAGVKSWSAFARGASAWSIEETAGKYQIVGYRTHEKGYWVKDDDQRLEFPSDATVNQVIDRMITIIQEAARKRGAN